jgi:hypothetical protein
MLIRDIIREGYEADLIQKVQDILVMRMDSDESLSTEEFKQLLSDEGYVATTDEIIKAVNDSGYASSIDKELIKLKNQMSADVDTDEQEPSVDVGKMAGDQALSDIKAEL